MTMFKLVTVFHHEELAQGPLAIAHGPVEILHCKKD